jgi:signal transduction histidine kinase
MRRRLTIAILLLIAATVVVTTLGSFFFVRRAAISTTQQELAGQAKAISTTFSGVTDFTRVTFRRELKAISKAGAFSGVNFVRLNSDGTIRGTLPSGITERELDVGALVAGDQVTGHTSSLLAYSAVPTPLDNVKAFVPVLVITRQIHNPANGLRYFGWVGVIALAAAALVAAALARRFTRPLVAAVATTGRIASGDLDATVPIGRREDPEFVQLAESINTMGANLMRARDQERQFILSVSHELRTPLTSIRGYADAVVDGAAEDPVAAASVIGTEAHRLERLVQDLLDLARLDADRFSLDIRTIDGSTVARQVADGFRPRAGELGLELSTAPGSEQPLWVDADADRLAQVVANLVENAFSFARQRVVVGAGLVAGSPTIWVSDDGPGIPAAQLPLVFERHFSSDRAGGRRKGSGLGLAIVAELAAAMGAGVRAESTGNGNGTTMLIWFHPAAAPTPLPPPPVTPPPAAAAPAAAPAAAAPPAAAAYPPQPTPSTGRSADG